MNGISNEGDPDSGFHQQDANAQKVVRMVERMFRQAKKAREKRSTDWVSNYKFVWGKQWEQARPSYRHSEVLNFTHAAIQTIIPILTDTRPNIQTIPEEPSDYEFSELLNQILVSKWDRDMYSRIVSEAIVDASIYGTAISEQGFDPDRLLGLGDITFKTKDPAYCYPDPNAEDINDGIGKYFILAEPTDVSIVKRKYPKMAHLIKSDLSDIESAKTSKLDMDDYRIRSATDNLTLVQGDRSNDEEKSDQVLLITCYMHDDESEEQEIERQDEFGKTKKAFQQVKKYPNGRKIVMANGSLLEDGDNPYTDGKFPYARFVDYIRPREFWGQGEVEALKGPQMVINKLLSYVMDTIVIMGNPIWVVSTDSGVDTNNLFNVPGSVVEKNPSGEVRREAGVGMPPHILALFDRVTDLFDKISGIYEVSQGVAPSANSSGLAIERLQEAAQTKLRLKNRNMEQWLTQVGQQLVSRILQFYTVPRVIRLTENQGAEKYFRFHVQESMDESGLVQRTAAVTPITQDPSGQFIEGEISQYEIRGNLDVKITTGTSLPFAKAQKTARARELLELGIMDEEDYLTAIEWPNKERILEKLRRRKDAAAAAEQQQAQALEGVPQGQPPLQVVQ